MIITTLQESLNVIDLRLMLHLMPDQFEAALQWAKIGGALCGLSVGVGLSWLAFVIFHMVSRRKPPTTEARYLQLPSRKKKSKK